MKRTSYILLLLLASFGFNAQNWLGFDTLIPSTPWAGFVQSLYTSPDGNKLYIGGAFNSKYGGRQMKSIIAYDGTTFDSLGSGVGSGGYVNDIIEYKNNTYICGTFDHMGTKLCRSVAKWDGVKWDSLGTQLSPTGIVYTFKVYNNELYLGGNFDKIGNQTIRNIVKYDGTNWIPLASPFKFTDSSGYTVINCIEVYNNELYVGGYYFRDSLGNYLYLAKYNGTKWDTVNVKLYGGITEVNDMKIYNNKLYVAGRFKKSEGNIGNAIMRYDGTTWSDVSKAVTDLGTCLITNMEVINNKLWVVGGFKSIEDTLFAGGIACWNDTVWCVPPTGPQNYKSTSIAYFKNHIYMGGAFSEIGNDTVHGFAMLNTDSLACAINITNVKTHTKNEDFIISPNPFTDNITIQVPSKYNLTDTKFTITNSLGQVLLNYYPLSYKQNLNLSNLSSGIYYLTMQDRSINRTVKLIKQ